jgi:hypothetical protein
MAGINLGEFLEREYVEVFLRRRRGGDARPERGGDERPDGVVTGEVRENSASSALDSTRRNGGMVAVNSFGGDDSAGFRVVSAESTSSGSLLVTSQTIMVESEPLEISVI